MTHREPAPGKTQAAAVLDDSVAWSARAYVEVARQRLVDANLLRSDDDGAGVTRLDEDAAANDGSSDDGTANEVEHADGGGRTLQQASRGGNGVL